jgi:hypothetical protein
MFDCTKVVFSYHDDEITLSRAEQKNMRERRDVNRTRLKEGLQRAGRPAPADFETQGSYAMRTMIQLPGKDWDIDDGVYFDAADLKGEHGGDIDEALVHTLRAIRDRLELDLVIEHPVTPNETITEGTADASASFFRDKIKEGLESLQILDDPSCTRTQALTAWDKFYATDYFSKRVDANARAMESASFSAPAILTSRTQAAPPPVRKECGGRYA